MQLRDHADRTDALRDWGLAHEWVSGALLDASLAPGLDERERSGRHRPLSHKATRVQNGYVSSGMSWYPLPLQRS